MGVDDIPLSFQGKPHGDRNARSHHHQHRKRIERRAHSVEATEFFNVLSSQEMLETVDALSPPHRERLSPPTVALSMFVQQTLDADASCQKVLNGWVVQRAACGLKPNSTRTGAYCRARSRLPLPMIRGLACETTPDTEEKQARYPQPDSQADGVGFPLARVVVVICLATGAVWDEALGAHTVRVSRP